MRARVARKIADAAAPSRERRDRGYPPRAARPGLMLAAFLKLRRMWRRACPADAAMVARGDTFDAGRAFNEDTFRGNRLANCLQSRHKLKVRRYLDKPAKKGAKP